MGVWTERDGRTHEFKLWSDYCENGRWLGYIRSAGTSCHAFGATGHRLSDAGVSIQEAKRLVEETRLTDTGLHVCPHPEGHDNYVLEVRKYMAGDDPAIPIFHTEVTHSVRGLWTQTFGSVGALNIYLRGLQTILGIEGFPSINLSWSLPEQWQEPSALRWTMSRDGSYKQEELNAAGAVIKI